MKQDDKNEISLFGVGFFGVGPHKSCVNGEVTAEYKYWVSMMTRCYTRHHVTKAYIEVRVCKEWHNFQNFAEWCQTQIGFGMPRWQLDKDVLSKGPDKHYGPDVCVFLPPELNLKLPRKAREKMGDNLIAGVYINRSGSFATKLGNGGKTLTFKNYEDAVAAHKTFRKSVIRECADKYKDVIDPRVYEAVYLIFE